MVYVYTESHTLIKGETFVEDTFASWKNFQTYGNKLFQKTKFLNQGHNR